MKDFKEELKNLPEQPGVYLMKDNENNVIYVGKAKVLKKRISQYFQNTAKHSTKTLNMVLNIEKFEYITTDSEFEAFILECNLIKKYRPKYNIVFKDDKSYIKIKLTLNEPYPGIYVTRQCKKDGSEYYGPYVSSATAYEIVTIVRKIFKIRGCSRILPRDIGKKRACLYHHIGQCSAPCEGKMSQEQYFENFQHIRTFLKGNFGQVLADLNSKMLDAAATLDFEYAAAMRDKIDKIINLNKTHDTALVNNSVAKTLKLSADQYDNIPKQLKRLLKLKNLPVRIEVYDISNISGCQNVGVCVVYQNGNPVKKCYRKFNIKTIAGADDYGSMRELIYRRINNYYDTDKANECNHLPDLIFLDGGHSHVSVVLKVMESLGEDIPVFGLVKDNRHKTRAVVNETEEFNIEKNSVLFKFLTALQHEVHRFAISTYRKKHEKSMIKSELEEINGIGKAKRTKLLANFGDIGAIKKADVSDLAKVIDRRSALKVYNYFHSLQ